MFRALNILFCTLITVASAGAQSPTPVGVWLHPNQRIQIEIAPCGQRLCGKLVWFRRPNDAQGIPLVDFKNALSTLRTRPLLGLTVLQGLRRTGERTWDDGRIYNPDDGMNYDASMSIETNGTLRVRAYVLMSPLGETIIWRRIR